MLPLAATHLSIPCRVSTRTATRSAAPYAVWVAEAGRHRDKLELGRLCGHAPKALRQRHRQVGAAGCDVRRPLPDLLGLLGRHRGLLATIVRGRADRHARELLGRLPSLHGLVRALPE